jgi:hypothetical protein
VGSVLGRVVLPPVRRTGGPPVDSSGTVLRLPDEHLDGAVDGVARPALTSRVRQIAFRQETIDAVNFDYPFAFDIMVRWHFSRLPGG